MAVVRRPLKLIVRSRHGAIWFFTAFDRSLTTSAYLSAGRQRIRAVTCNRFGGSRISLDVSVVIFPSSLGLDRRRLSAGRSSRSLAPGVVRLCQRQDQMPIVRCSVCIQIPSVGSEGLPELWI